MSPAFGARITAAMAEHGPLCVGIDPHPRLLAEWGLGDDAPGLRAFSLQVVAALGGRVAALKPQSAFFERHGSAGIAVLEEVLAAARQSGTLTILDAKRGDIGSTMTGYAEAYLAPDAPLACDALTLSPFLGAASLQPAVDLALAHGRGVFLLALTSNPEGRTVQHARDADGRSVAAGLVDYARAHNVAGPTEAPGAGAAAETGTPVGPLGSVGLVVGATTGSAVRELGLDLAASRAPLLAPGVGAQGAGGAELAEVFGDARGAVLASSSRAVLGAGPGGLREAAGRSAAEAAAALAAG